MSISNLYATALSGLSASDAMLNSAAASLASANAAGYQSARTNGTAANEGNQPTMSSADPGTELVQLMLAKAVYDADARVLEAADSMIGNLIDVVARAGT